MADSTTSLFPLPAAVFRERIKVRLDSGKEVERDPSELVEIPAHLVGALEDLEPPAAT